MSSSSVDDNAAVNTARPSFHNRRRNNNDRLKVTLQSQANDNNQQQQQINNNIINNNNDDVYKQRHSLLQSNSKLALAPMMEYTDRHFRHLIRLLSSTTIVYSEMVPANAIAHHITQDQSGDDALRFLQQGHVPEGPSVLQLGGSDVHQLYTAAQTVQQYYELQQQQMNEYDSNSCWVYNSNSNDNSGAASAAAAAAVLNGKRDALLNKVHVNYTAINLNCGCPSPKVANKGCFGAALMSNPNHVAQLTKALHDGAQGSMPITVKCRIGTDDWMNSNTIDNNGSGNGGLGFTRDRYITLRSMKDEYTELCNFIETVANGGIVTHFHIHARIAVLYTKDYTPSDNRKVPPLRYEHVRQLTIDYPELQFSLNGGCDTLVDVQRELELCDRLQGVMVGRGFVANPWGFATADELLYPTSKQQRPPPRNRLEILEEYGKHADYEEARYGSSKVRRYIVRAITNLFAGEHNSKHYRIALDDIVALSSLRKQRRILRGEEEEEENELASSASQLLLSELILQAATKHLSEEVLYRTPQESYDRMVYMAEQAERKKNVITTVMFGR
jgi:tRNA-dihydrouridine synthase A